MCIIIDADVAANFFSKPSEKDHKPVWDYITKKNGRLVYGAKLKTELFNIGEAKKRIMTWNAAGIAFECKKDQIEEDQEKLVNLGLCESNDFHVLALARISHTRILFSNDDKLCRDFRNTEIVPRPRGEIYRKNEDRNKLVLCPRCPASKKRKKRN